MKRTLLLTLFFIGSCLWINACAQCYGSLIWNDEFNDANLNQQKWIFQTGDGCPNLCGWGNSELEYYTNSNQNTYLSNGNLVLKVLPENLGGASFSSGKIFTNGTFSQTYGRFEARMKMPLGAGLWPAFWMLPVNNQWPTTGEIDIMEYRGDQATITQATLHYGAAWPNNKYDGSVYNTSIDLSADFHVYAVEWSDNDIKWFFDGTVIKTETKNPNSLDPVSNANAWPWDKDFYIILNLAVGGWFTGVTSANNVVLTKPTFEIDYVRVYDMNSNTQLAYNGTINAIPGKIEAEDYDVKCGGAYHDDDANNQGGKYRGDGVDIENCSDAGGGYDVGWTNTNEWLDYSVHINQTGVYDLNLRIASGAGSGSSMHVEVDGNNVSGNISVPNTGGWQNWQILNINNVALSSGNHMVKVVFDGNNINFNYMEWIDMNTSVMLNESNKIIVSFTDDNVIFKNVLDRNFCVYSLEGKLMYVSGNMKDNIFTLPTSTWSSGVYYFQSNQQCEKFVVRNSY